MNERDERKRVARVMAPLQLEPQMVLVEQENGAVEQAAWVHVSLEQVADVYKRVKFGHFCETPIHKHNNIQAVMFHAVFYHDRVDTWVSCWACYQAMLPNDPSSSS